MAIIGNYKHDRLFGRGEGYGEAVIASAYGDAKDKGEFSISRYESKNGEHIKFKLDGSQVILEE